MQAVGYRRGYYQKVVRLPLYSRLYLTGEVLRRLLTTMLLLGHVL